MKNRRFCSNSLKENVDIVFVGACSVELVSYVSALPKFEETIKGYNIIQRFGGKGANQSIATAKLGASVGLISKLGNDSIGKEYLKELQKYNSINTKYIWLMEHIPTGITSVAVSNNDLHQIIVVPGANAYLFPSDVDIARHMLLSAKVVVFQGETPWETTVYCLTKLLVSTQARSKIIVNASPATYPLNPIVMVLADILCMNEHEAEVVTDMKIDTEENLVTCMEKLLAMKCNTVIITLGKYGVVYASKESPRLKTVAVDHIADPLEVDGVGDCFVGALAYYFCYLPDLPLGEIIRRSCQIARSSLFNVRLQSSFPDKKHLDEKLFLPTCQLGQNTLILDKIK